MCNGWKNMASWKPQSHWKKIHENFAYLNLKCRSTTNSLYVCKWFEWIGHNIVTGFYYGCTHNRPSLRMIRSSLFRRKRKNCLTWMNMEPSLLVCITCLQYYPTRVTNIWDKSRVGFRPTKKVNLYVIVLFLQKQRPGYRWSIKWSRVTSKKTWETIHFQDALYD